MSNERKSHTGTAQTVRDRCQWVNSAAPPHPQSKLSREVSDDVRKHVPIPERDRSAGLLPQDTFPLPGGDGPQPVSPDLSTRDGRSDRPEHDLDRPSHEDADGRWCPDLQRPRRRKGLPPKQPLCEHDQQRKVEPDGGGRYSEGRAGAILTAPGLLHAEALAEDLYNSHVLLPPSGGLIDQILVCLMRLISERGITLSAREAGVVAHSLSVSLTEAGWLLQDWEDGEIQAFHNSKLREILRSAARFSTVLADLSAKADGDRPRLTRLATGDC